MCSSCHSHRFRLMILPQTVELLFDCLCLCLSLCRNADVNRDVHNDSPDVSTPWWRGTMMVCSLEAAADRLDPTDAARQEPQSWSVECSTVVFSLLSAFGQHICSVASEGHCISCGKPLLADILGRCFIRLRQNLSFVMIPLKTVCIGSLGHPLREIENEQTSA